VIALNELLVLSAALFILGVVGFIIRRNILIMFMSIELMLNAAGIVLVGFSNKLGRMDPQVFTVFVIALAAAEAAVGLAIIIALFRNRESVNIDEMKLLKW
jgi:NADH-quinone oxidoreductase subunit K